MKRGKFIWMMTFVTVLLVACCVVVYLREDRIGPEIQFEMPILYKDGISSEQLLEGVSAVDTRDGDVSDTLRIDQIIEFSDENYVIVTYVAKDNSNNVTKANRQLEW